jgi:hypothetical protein
MEWLPLTLTVGLQAVASNLITVFLEINSVISQQGDTLFQLKI